MATESMGSEPRQESQDEKYDRLVKGLYDGVQTRLSGLRAQQMELLDHRHVTAMPSGEIAKAIVDANVVDGDTSAGLWAELQWEGFSTADVSVANQDITPAGHERLVSRRAEVMDRLAQSLKLDGGYSELRPDEKKVFLEANFVRFVSELAKSFSDRVDVLKKELATCRNGA